MSGLPDLKRLQSIERKWRPAGYCLAALFYFLIAASICVRLAIAWLNRADPELVTTVEPIFKPDGTNTFGQMPYIFFSSSSKSFPMTKIQEADWDGWHQAFNNITSVGPRDFKVLDEGFVSMVNATMLTPKPGGAETRWDQWQTDYEPTPPCRLSVSVTLDCNALVYTPVVYIGFMEPDIPVQPPYHPLIAGKHVVTAYCHNQMNLLTMGIERKFVPKQGTVYWGLPWEEVPIQAATTLRPLSSRTRDMHGDATFGLEVVIDQTSVITVSPVSLLRQYVRILSSVGGLITVFSIVFYAIFVVKKPVVAEFTLNGHQQKDSEAVLLKIEEDGHRPSSSDESA